MAAALAVTAGAALAQEGEPTRPETYRLPVSEEFYNGCTGEIVALEDELQVVISNREGANGFHGFSLYKLHLAGVSSSGARYILQSASWQVIDLDLEWNERATTRITETFIRQGEDGTQDDGRAVLLVHLTRNANREPTAQVEFVESECN